MLISLRPVTVDNFDLISDLPLLPQQRDYLASNDYSIAQASFHPAILHTRAVYGDEESNLKISRIVTEFVAKHVRNFFKRVFYNYYLRNLSVASLELPIGVALSMFGTVFGIIHWIASAQSDVATPAGTVMLAALPVIMGVQFILGFLNYDIASVPTRPLHKKTLFRRRSNG